MTLLCSLMTYSKHMVWRKKLIAHHKSNVITHLSNTHVLLHWENDVPFLHNVLDRQTDRQTDRHADRERYSLPAIRLLYTVVRCSFPTFMRIIIYINKQNCRPHQLKNNNSSLSAHNEFSVSLKRIVVPLVLRLATMKLKRKRWSKSN